MLTPPSHTSHILQPLGVSCFRPFKFTFKREKNESMFKHNHRDLDKVTLAGWADKTLNRSLSKQNQNRVKTTRIWPLNPRAMDNRNKPNELYTTKSKLDISNDEDGQSE